MAKAKDTLAKYRAKRDFKKTREPEGIVKKSKGFSYLIQKHEASHLHYDFRLELDGALKSWAVPKGPSLDPADKRLAMQVEDHPVAYGTFEGIIPKGEYGGGTVMLWDRGTWEPVGDAQQGLEKGKLVFKLHGERLKGEWTLVRSFRREGKGNGWLLIKHRDEEVVEGDGGSFVQENATSIITGRTMEEIAADQNAVWKNKHEVKQPKKKTATKPKGKPAKMPKFTPPQLATLTTTMPKSPDWVHELKFDGYRMIAHINAGEVKIFSRNGKDWTAAFQSIADILAELPVKNAIIDGELVVVNAQGKSDFSELKDALSEGKTNRFQYYVFDLLHLNGKNLTALPLLARKEQLLGVLQSRPKSAHNKRVIYSEHFTDENHQLFQHVCGLQLEGLISKRADAPYYSGRSKIWLKTKCQKRQEFVIGGFTLSSVNKDIGLGSLLLGYYDGKNLEYAGRVGTGFDRKTSMSLRKMLDKLRQKESAYIAVSQEGKRGAIWVKPQLVAEVEFTEWTPDGHLRHPSFKGLREDKSAREIIREKAVPLKAVIKESKKEMRKTAPVKKAPRKPVEVAGITISHPDRVIYPDAGITKLQLAEYYAAIAKHLLPYVANRPLSMLRCPEGSGEPCFFQRHVGFGHSPHLYEVDVSVKKTERDYVMIKDIKGLITLAQWGVIELHPWQCTAKNLDKPNQMIFDLDPDPGVSFPALIKAAKEIRKRLSDLRLKSFLKTTGGKGLHVVVPMTPSYAFPAIKAFARAIAQSMENDHPELYIATMSKEKRKGKIFIDYLRNDVTSTAVAPFSARARTGATVATPLAWEELKSTLKPSSFTIDTIPKRLSKLKKDPWADFGKTHQKIPREIFKVLKIPAV